jgi:pentatricopeptide repeat protein
VASVTTFGTVIDACAKAGDLPKAEAWFDAMLDAQIEPNVVSFSAMIDGCAKKADPDRAKYWFNRMLKLNIKPNPHTFSAIITAYSKVRDPAKAEEWLWQAEKAGIRDGVIYTSALAACSKPNDAARARKIFQRMLDNGIKPHIKSYSALARPFSYGGDWVEVERIADEMSESGVQSNEYFLNAQLISYAIAKPRQDKRAEQCFRQALGSGMEPNDHTITALTRAVGRVRCIELMRELCNGRAVPYSLCHVRKAGKDGWFPEPKNAGGSNNNDGMVNHDGTTLDIKDYCKLAKPSSYSGDWAEVERIANEMSTKGVESNEYFLNLQLVSFAIAKPRQDERAEQCFRQALRSGIEANDHVVIALTRAVGRTRCLELMQELCNGRSVPYSLCHVRKEGKEGWFPESSDAGGNDVVGGNKKSLWHRSQ